MNRTIETIPHSNCFGCGACLNKCPTNAIQMQYDSEGFLYPQIIGNCIACGQCVSVCPAENTIVFHGTPKSYAVWAQDDVRLQSSSGGMFTLLAEEILRRGGKVCGAAYAKDYRSVYHIWAEKTDDLCILRGSKYVQSDTMRTFQETKRNLERGIPVLYTGCPCQISGLYQYLGKPCELLYTADLICHGANSVYAYRSFLEEFAGKKEIKKVDFRDKTFFPWSSNIVVFFKDGTHKKAAFKEAMWYKGFLEGIVNRENCYSCPYARAERISDITLGDCWQIHRIDPQMDDRKGTSLVLVNTEKGSALFESAKSNMKRCEEVNLNEVKKYNGQLNYPPAKNPSRKYFFEHLLKDGYHKSLWYGRGMRFDVGLVGWWFASNYGSCLTYYALGCMLSQIGKQILLIRLPTMSGAPWDTDTQISVRFLSKFFKVSAERNMYELPEVNRFCDAFMTGSDQMWRQDAISLVGYSFFLDFVDNDKKKIAFSTSFGNEHFTDQQDIRETVADYLRRFDAISVREKSGVDVCKREFGIIAQQLLDPVLICEKEYYDKITKDIADEVPQKYLLCYILDPSGEKEQIAKEIAEHEGLQILTILGMKEYDFARKQWSVGRLLPKISPEQFVYYIKNCTFLLTDSHHGACFGIVYHKQYLAIVNERRGAVRFKTVAETLHLENRIIFSKRDLADQGALYQAIDYDKVDQILEVERARAMSWLKYALLSPHRQIAPTLSTAMVDSYRRDAGLKAEIQKLSQAQKRQEQTINELQNALNEANQRLHQCCADHGLLYTVKYAIVKVWRQMFSR